MHRLQLNWFMLPAAVLWTVVSWQRFGPVIAIIVLVAGVGLGLWGNARYRKTSGRE